MSSVECGKLKKVSDVPVLMKSFHPTKNGDLRPEDISVDSETAVWWIYKGGHEIKTRVIARAKSAKKCKGSGMYGVITDSEELISQWHPTKNVDIDPSSTSQGYNKKVWWRCENGHEWEASVVTRSIGGQCPVCLPKELVESWHPTKNGDLKPSDYTADSKEAVWWIYENGLEICTRIDSRVKGLLVKKESILDYPEIAEQWHPTKNVNYDPNAYGPSSNIKVWWKCKNDHEWQDAINKRFNGEGCPLCLPEKLVAQWHPTKNGDLKASDFNIHSEEAVWWICSGYELKIRINVRYAGTKVKRSAQMLIDMPEIMKIWDAEDNIDIDPTVTSVSSHKNAVWICEKGHKSSSRIGSKTTGTNCPHCTGRMVSDETCLATLYPEIAAQWHPTKNGTETAYDVTPGSNKEVWWICDKGHEWKVSVNSRVNSGKGSRKSTGCPYCSGKKVAMDNCLAIRMPDVAKTWNHEKNGNTTPYDVTTGTNRKFWWKCEKGHEWQARVSDRAKGTGCPRCSGRQVSEINSLASKRPDVAAQWHPTKNGNETPDTVSYACNDKVWWQCEKGHEWQARVTDRTSKDNPKCPICSGRRVTMDNCLATTHPELLKSWHPTKNVDISPYKVTAGSNKKAWWVCENGHEWETSIRVRTLATKNGCKQCHYEALKNKKK